VTLSSESSSYSISANSTAEEEVAYSTMRNLFMYNKHERKVSPVESRDSHETNETM
jgi:hypothetical protein